LSDDECESISSDDSYEDVSDFSESSDVSAPQFSPITSSDNSSINESATTSIELTCNGHPPITHSISPEPVSEPSATNAILSYKITGDNLDLNVRPRFMRLKRYQTQSLHLFHSYAVKDRIDTSGMDDVNEHLCLPSPEILVKSLLPTREDDDALRENIEVLIARTLVQHLNFFETSFKDIVPCHIPHSYEAEMSKKSEVPLGILAKNENRGGEMIDIMNHLHSNYVPTLEKEETVVVGSTQEKVDVIASKTHKILFGGDQLTAARARSAIRNVDNGDTASSKLSGLIPVIEDWHTKMTVLVVSGGSALI
jgi:L1 cell adhesion molecule like protein